MGIASRSCPATRAALRVGSAWPLERVLFALAGTVTLLASALAAVVSPWFLLLSAFAGINQWLYVWLGACPASLALGRLMGLRSAIYAPNTAARSVHVSATDCARRASL